jgi:hypothetical protein
MATAWPQVKAWIAATVPGLLPAFQDAEVYSGLPATMSAAGKFITVGAVGEEDNAGTYGRSPHPDGFSWTEIGDVRSMIVAQSGDSDGATNEASAFAMAEALDAAIHGDRTLGGVLSVDSLAETSIDVLVISNANGTATALVHNLRYTTTTFQV